MGVSFSEDRRSRRRREEEEMRSIRAGGSDIAAAVEA